MKTHKTGSDYQDIAKTMKTETFQITIENVLFFFVTAVPCRKGIRATAFFNSRFY